MKKEDAIRVIIKCAKQYRDNLDGKNLLFLFGSPQIPEFFEALFLPRHFLHLTGVALNESRVISSNDFYDRCLNGRLNPQDFNIPNTGTVEMKLSVLPSLIMIHNNAKMVGEYYQAKSVLYTEKLAGNISACMGFVQNPLNGYYVPNTVLKEDIRQITQSPQKRVIAIFRKAVEEEIYTELRYVAKGIDLSTVSLPNCIQAST